MSDTQLLYNYPSDEWSHLLTPTFPVGGQDADFPVTNLQLGNPAVYFQATGTAVTLQYDRATAQGLGLCGLRGNFTGSVSIAVSNDPTFATGVTTFALAVQPADQEGYYDACWLDLTAAPTARYLRIIITGNALDVIISWLWLGVITRALPHHVQLASKTGATRPRIPPVVTIAGVEMVSQSYGRRRTFEGTIVWDDTIELAIDLWLQACGGIDQPCLIVVKSGAAGPGRGRASAWLVRWNTTKDADFLFTDTETGIVTIAVGWIEVAPGRPLGST